MGRIASERNWCHTCGSYVQLGTHGLHDSRYGRGPSEERPPEAVGAAEAVGIVLVVVVGSGFLLFLLFMALTRN